MAKHAISLASAAKINDRHLRNKTNISFQQSTFSDQLQNRAKPSVIAILGPTGSGKTALAIELAKRLKTQIISCDSRGIYKNLKSLTAVPPGQWRRSKDGASIYKTQEGIPYHLADFLSPAKKWSAQDFSQAAEKKIKSILQKNTYAIVAGGSGFYWKALAEGLDDLPPSDPKLRQRLNRQFKKDGLSSLLKELKRLDIKTFKRIDRKNPRRVQRALELCFQLKKPLSLHLAQSTARPMPWPYTAFCLDWPTEILKKRLTLRVRKLLPGILQELALMKKRYGVKFIQLPAFEALMARPLWQLLNHEIDQETAIAQCAQRDYQYARRQKTWFKRQTNIKHILLTNKENLHQKLFLQKTTGLILSHLNAEKN